MFLLLTFDDKLSYMQLGNVGDDTKRLLRKSLINKKKKNGTYGIKPGYIHSVGNDQKREC